MAVTLATYAGLACATVIFVWAPIFVWARTRWYKPRRPTTWTPLLGLLGWLDTKRSELFSCAQCLGTWLGLLWSLTNALSTGRRDSSICVAAVLDGAIVGVLAWLLYLLGRVLDEYPAPRGGSSG